MPLAPRSTITLRVAMRRRRAYDPSQPIDPDSDEWHLHMAKLTTKTRCAAHFNSSQLKTCLEHTEMDAKPINMMTMMTGNGVHGMMGQSWKDPGHQDVWDESTGTCIDHKEGPKELRDQDQDFSREGDRRTNPILEGFKDRDVIETPPSGRMFEAGTRMMAEEAAEAGETTVQGGKLARADTPALERLFGELDVDKSGSLDHHEIMLLAAAGGKKLTKRQVHHAMKEMDGDGSGEVDFPEFAKWWRGGVVAPARGTDVFRRVCNKLETKCKNMRTVFRKFDENSDGTISHHELRKGLTQVGIELNDGEFGELLDTLDEDNSNEIDYNEFANSGVMGGKYFSARNPNGFSGCSTKKDLIDKRKNEYRAFGNRKMQSFWEKQTNDPRLSIGAIVWAGGAGY